MDYEKLHKDTITKLQEMVNSGKITVETACGICADFIPESEDKRFRKAILWCISTVEHELGCKVIEGFTATELKSWLEKQGEQNLPIEKLLFEFIMNNLETI